MEFKDLFKVNLDGEITNMDCGCWACNHEIQAGHFSCHVPLPEMLELEENDEIVRSYQNGKWRWYLNN